MVEASISFIHKILYIRVNGRMGSHMVEVYTNIRKRFIHQYHLLPKLDLIKLHVNLNFSLKYES